MKLLLEITEYISEHEIIRVCQSHELQEIINEMESLNNYDVELVPLSIGAMLRDYEYYQFINRNLEKVGFMRVWNSDTAYYQENLVNRCG